MLVKAAIGRNEVTWLFPRGQERCAESNLISHTMISIIFTKHMKKKPWKIISKPIGASCNQIPGLVIYNSYENAFSGQNYAS